MKFLFSPAITLMSRLKYPAKFAVMGLMAVLAVGYLLTTLIVDKSKAIRQAGNERAALELIGPVHKLVQVTQQHRGLSAGFLNGNAGMKDKLGVKTADVERVILEVDKVEVRHAELLKTTSEWTAIKSDWMKLRKSNLSMILADSLAAHSTLIARMLQLQINVAEEGSLFGDPSINSYYIVDTMVHRLPEMLEHLGKARGKGTASLVKKELQDDDKAIFEVHLAGLRQNMDVLNESLGKVGERNTKIASSLSQLTKELGAGSTEVMAVVSGMLNWQFGVTPQDFFDKSTKTIDVGYRGLFDILIPTQDSLLQNRQSQLQQELSTQMAISAIFVLFLIWLSGGAYFAVIHTVHELSRETTKMAGGDLTVRIAMSTRDELSEVGESFNKMAESMQTLLRSVQNTAGSVSDAANELSGSAKRVANSSTEQSDAATGMASSVQQMTAQIEQISEHARTAQQISAESGDLSKEGGRIVDDTVREMERIADTVNQSAEIIERLGKHSESISAIVNAIKEIADQTNLLALNAAIEAARAGEQGRGFAVVADEVRKLAERTSHSTQEISSMITAIQDGTKSAVDSMKTGVERVAEGVALSRHAGESIGKIQQGTEKVRNSVGGISSAMDEQSLASNEIARGVERIAQMAERNSADVRNTAETVLRLEQMAAALQTEVKRFRV